MRVLVGTSGYSYPEWKGTFYPEDLPSSGMLRFYAGRFQTVEINNTFYRMPTASVLERWAEEVSPEFSFVLKASRRITHDARLQDVADPVSYFFNTAQVLGEKLGPVLFQLPPFMKKDAARIKEFLSLLPKERRVALEFRHATWFDDEVFDVLRAHGAALCLADTDEGDDAPVVSTAGWGYLRLRRQEYGDQELSQWAKQISQQPWEEAYVFFKHEEAGTGPRLAARFMKLSA